MTKMTFIIEPNLFVFEENRKKENVEVNSVITSYKNTYEEEETDEKHQR